MLLRESSEKAGAEANIPVVTGQDQGDSGVPHGEFLLDLAEAVARWRWDDVAALREQGLALFTPEQLGDAILVASGFNGITRVADAIGIRLDPWSAAASEDWRTAAGINAFAPETKWAAL